jgi:hypothetical protein
MPAPFPLPTRHEYEYIKQFNNIIRTNIPQQAQCSPRRMLWWQRSADLGGWGSPQQSKLQPWHHYLQPCCCGSGKCEEGDDSPAIGLPIDGLLRLIFHCCKRRVSNYKYIKLLEYRSSHGELIYGTSSGLFCNASLQA